MQVAEALPDDLQSIVVSCMAAVSAPSTNKKTFRMLRHLTALDPPVLPMYSQERFVRAIQQVLMKGGKNGAHRCENAVYDFVRAVRLWHGVARTQAVEENLTSSWAKDMLKGMRHMAPAPIPKNEAHMIGAEHGHLPLPYDYFVRCLRHADSILRPHDPYFRIGFQRDVLIMVLLICLTRRFNEAQQAEHIDFVDLGVGKGMNWRIKQMKNLQRRTTIVPIPECTAGGLDICGRIRRFLTIGPRTGRLFRGTINAGGLGGHIWEPEIRPTVVFDANDAPTWGWTESAYYSGEWNAAFQLLLAQAVPEVNARLYTAHSLRVGGITAGASAGMSIQQLASCAVHQSLDTTSIYIRPDLEAKRDIYSKLGGGLATRQLGSGQ